MRVRFTLSMDDLVVDDRLVDSCTIAWEEDRTRDELLDLSERWITTQNFLTRRMIGLQRVGESSLTIEPLEANSTSLR
ncbi:MAG: hypothetical protein ACOYUK_03025 [Patescibacteria group bacterium]